MARRRDYRAMARAVNKYVAWDLSRRKTFTAAEKGRITRAFNELRSIRAAGLTPVRIRRRPGESDRSHRARLAALRRSHGQSGSHLAAIAVRVSSSETVTVRARTVTVRSKVTGRSQWYESFRPVAIARGGVRAEVMRAVDVVRGAGADTYRLALGSRRRGDFASYTDDTLDDMLDAAADLEALYGLAALAVLQGVYGTSGGGWK